MYGKSGHLFPVKCRAQTKVLCMPEKLCGQFISAISETFGSIVQLRSATIPGIWVSKSKTKLA